MPAVDHGFKEIARHAGKALARVAGLECEGWSPIESTLQKTTEKLADRAFRTKIDGTPCVVYMEFIAEWNPDDLWSFQSKAALLSEKERLPTVCVLFVLREAGYSSQNGWWRLCVGERLTQSLGLVEICLWEVDPPDWWKREDYLLPLLPICRRSGSEREVIEEATAGIQELTPNPTRRADLLALLTIFGEFAFPSLGVTEMIANDLIAGSKFFTKVAEDSFLEGQRSSIIRLLSVRFPDEALTDIQNSLNQITDQDRLLELIAPAAQEQFLASFRKLLKPKRKKKS